MDLDGLSTEEKAELFDCVISVLVSQEINRNVPGQKNVGMFAGCMLKALEAAIPAYLRESRKP